MKNGTAVKSNVFKNVVSLVGPGLITAAVVLGPGSITANSTAGATMGYLLLWAIVAAAFSSFIVNAMIGGTMLADGLNLGHSMESKWSKIFASIVMVIGTIAAIVFGQNPVQLLILAQGTTIFAVPLIAIVMLLLSNDESLMKEYKNKTITNVISIIAIIWLIYLSYNQLMRFIG